jgi:glycerate 2-kinase
MSWDDARACHAPRSVFDIGIVAAAPRKVPANDLPAKAKGRCIVVGIGKSAAVTAAVLENAWPAVAVPRMVH